jgi:hypothetical protein
VVQGPTNLIANKGFGSGVAQIDLRLVLAFQAGVDFLFAAVFLRGAFDSLTQFGTYPPIALAF